MSQHLLAVKLQEKLGFVENPDRARTKRLVAAGESNRVKKRHTPKGSIQLAPPDLLFKSPSPLKFNLREKQIYQEQIQKVQLETGLGPGLQKDLRICHLDRDTARLIFYSYRIGEITRNTGTIGLICDYVVHAKGAMAPPVSSTAFWTVSRLKYLDYIKQLKAKIETNRTLAPNATTLGCINDFLNYLTVAWGL